MTALTPGATTLSELIIEVFRVNGLALAAGDHLSGPAGLTSSRWQVLGVIDHGPESVATVARTMGLTRQTVRIIAAALEREGFVVYEENPHHRTAKLLVITEAGRRALRQVEASHAAWANRLARGIDRERLRGALEGLRLVRDVLERDASRASRKA
ncbi:MarR family winged helix-turn-helix transcriptional regulator [Polyangium sp. y55x31]|uniref:MarR family winged helix-turn-helix transcriptional regulator n=1 Tax=Polyangium sp. y55x31 TaxID=3042688 RepID=UPI002482FC4D|nr:MarR family winged helix-turn-helix transcriptional regulator [Polyangium sp. y55x31]MDI1476349.1 MarR family winged helix-turn-helix transcriptional regulator [Polyangium sp. y55x31]